MSPCVETKPTVPHTNTSPGHTTQLPTSGWKQVSLSNHREGRGSYFGGRTHCAAVLGKAQCGEELLGGDGSHRGVPLELRLFTREMVI